MFSLLIYYKVSSINHHVPKIIVFRPAVLNVFRLADHLTNAVSARGPPKTCPHFLCKISDEMGFLVISPKFHNFPPNSLHFSGTSTEISISSLVSLVTHIKKISKFPTLVAAHQADVPPVVRGPQVENRCFIG